MSNAVGAGLAPARLLAPAREGQPQGIAPTWDDTEDLRWAARDWATRIGVRLPYPL